MMNVIRGDDDQPGLFNTNGQIDASDYIVHGFSIFMVVYGGDSNDAATCAVARVCCIPSQCKTLLSPEYMVDSRNDMTFHVIYQYNRNTSFCK